MNGLTISTYINSTSVTLIIREPIGGIERTKTIQLSDQEILEIANAIEVVKERNK